MIAFFLFLIQGRIRSNRERSDKYWLFRFFSPSSSWWSSAMSFLAWWSTWLDPICSFPLSSLIKCPLNWKNFDQLFRLPEGIGIFTWIDDWPWKKNAPWLNVSKVIHRCFFAFVLAEHLSETKAAHFFSLHPFRLVLRRDFIDRSCLELLNCRLNLDETRHWNASVRHSRSSSVRRLVVAI